MKQCKDRVEAIRLYHEFCDLEPAPGQIYSQVG